MKKMLLVLVMLFSMVSCKSHVDHIEKLIGHYGKYPEFSIQLKDMKEENKKNFHKYSIYYGASMNPSNPKELTYKTVESGWKEVSPEQFNKYLPDLGMVVYSEKDGKAYNTPQPPGYDKVGNSRYGNWKTDSSGNRFWEFYGQYMFFSHMMGGRSVYYNDYNRYNSYRRSGRPYYGTVRNGKSTYGTTGTANKQSPFQKRVNKLNANKRSNFKSRLSRAKSSTRTFKTRESGKARVQRSRMNSVRSRSGRFGK